MRQSIANKMYDLMLIEKRERIWFGDIDIIEQCAKACGIVKDHPQKTIISVLNALEKSSKFKKGYIKADIGGVTHKYRCFTIVK